MIGEKEKIFLAEIFVKDINNHFLFDVLENYILAKPENVALISQLFSCPIDKIGTSQVIYLLSKVVVAIHRANKLMMSANEEKNALKSETYKEELASETMEQARIAPLNLQGLENTNTFLNEPYVAPAFIYSNIIVHAIVDNRDLSLKEIKKNKVTINLIYEACKSVISIMVLFQLGAHSQAITVYRNLLEQMVKLKIIELYPETRASYCRFCDYNVAYQNGRPSKQFLKELEEKKIRKAWTQNFLMYGWLDAIDTYNHNYSFKSATDLFSDGPNIYKLYEYASRFTHSIHIGLEYNWENLQYYFLINTLSLFRFVADTYRKYTKNKEEIVNGINIYDLMVKNGDRLQKIVSYLSTTQFA